MTDPCRTYDTSQASALEPLDGTGHLALCASVRLEPGGCTHTVKPTEQSLLRSVGLYVRECHLSLLAVLEPLGKFVEPFGSDFKRFVSLTIRIGVVFD